MRCVGGKSSAVAGSCPVFPRKKKARGLRSQIVRKIGPDAGGGGGEGVAAAGAVALRVAADADPGGMGAVASPLPKATANVASSPGTGAVRMTISGRRT